MIALPTYSPREMAEIAHELRAPLGGLQAMIEVLAETELDAGQRQVLEALGASALHLRQIANRLLGEKDPAAPAAPARMMLRPFLNRLARSAEARASQNGITFALLESRDLPLTADIDPVPLRQVLENLIDNAIRLTAQGRVVLAVAPAADGRLAFRVSDSGPGLTEAEAGRLIREGGHLEGRPGGAGMGLSLAGRLVAARGGTLAGGPNCDGHGAVFRFDWPILADLDEPACLIVDDHAASRAVLRTILQAAGLPCLEASSVEEATRLLCEYRPAHLVTDLRLDGGDGAELIRWVASQPAQERPRIVVVSADPVDSVPGLPALVDAAVRKPVNVRAVLEAVRGPQTMRSKPAA
ncbi:MAG: hybrid sensor histidine kinase/response regulator [Beijerinckiaceae bacterium]|nr:hybrid sensor histidine kinase/response regulator [Beijerinckiaceae bacterium]MCZ8301841.1 hybrid sensor histidine kinase/response regulator [Beijerinckiaceae bacterium]